MDSTSGKVEADGEKVITTKEDHLTPSYYAKFSSDFTVASKYGNKPFHAKSFPRRNGGNLSDLSPEPFGNEH